MRRTTVRTGLSPGVSPPRGTTGRGGWLCAGCAVLATAALLIPALAVRAGVPGSDSTTPGKNVSLAAAQALDAKIQILLNPETARPPSFQPIVITESEANSYLKYRGQEFLPSGVIDPEIHIAGPERVSGTAMVDFDELNRTAVRGDDWSSRILAWILSGKQRVSATGRLATGHGQAKLTVDNVTIGNTTVPQMLVDVLLQTYVQSRYGIDVRKPFNLPDHVTHIEMASGHATLIRSPDKK